MKVLLTLDYELYLGLKCGSVENCLIVPMSHILREVNSYNVKFSIFVDAAYLYMLNKHRKKYASLENDYDDICKHLLYLQEQGHDIQLHIHPQWYFSEYNGVEWSIDTMHYKLCDVDEDQMLILFLESKELLDNIIGKKTIAFRAGGFSAQPTELLRKLFYATGIRVDSSVCPGASYDSDCQKYDYTHVPPKSLYRFSEDICREDAQGDFTEFPITMITVSPVFHWKLALTKLAVKFDGGRHFKRMGDGISVKTMGSSIMERMTRFSRIMATIDEYKASVLKQAYREAVANGNEYFCVLGHPKLATSYSVKKLGGFCDFVKKSNGEFVTFSDCYEL